MSINGKTSIDFRVGDGAVVYQGQPLVDRGALYVTRGFAAAYAKGSNTKSAAEVFSGSGGKYFATPGGLQKHLLPHAEIAQASPNAQCCNSMTLASFKITVEKDGSITNIEVRSAPKSQADRISGLLANHKFKPFLFGSAQVTVDAILTIAIGPNSELVFVP